jgi:beta-phosphoglucomutase-like phosphatase (HAD superfamily)
MLLQHSLTTLSFELTHLIHRSSMQTPPLHAANEPLNSTRSPIAAVIFDLDGTLLDTETLSTAAMNQVLQRFGDNYEVLWELKKKILGMRGDQWGRVVVEDLQLTDKLHPEHLVRDWETNMNAMSGDVSLMPGAAELIHGIHARNIPMAVATSSSHATFQKKTDKYRQLFDLMSIIVCGDDPEVPLSSHSIHTNCIS